MIRIFCNIGFVILFCLHVEFGLLVHLVSGQEEEWVVAIVRESEGPSASVSGVDEELGDSFTTTTVSGDEKEIRSRSVYLVPGDTLDVKGAWTILPLLPKLLQLHPNVTWLLLLRHNTRLDWNELTRLTKSLDPQRDWFIGHQLFDNDATIIHHFAFHDNPKAFKYPHLEAGVLLSRPVLRRVCTKIGEQQLPRDFAIDVQHELALYLYSDNIKVNLTHSPAFCLAAADGCATWIKPFQSCETTREINSDQIFFAVKTCSKFHADRVPVVKQTWARQAQRLVFYSDTIDDTIPTVSLGVANTESGHCEKTMSIIHHLGGWASKQSNPPSWYVIADDDTIIGVRELAHVLSCYDSRRPLLLGEKYGYASGYHYGYDYITGGGGMILSRASVELIASSAQHCNCPSANTPDDMWLGACAESLNIAVVHFSGFHQARPQDYPPALLASQFVVSFHKHWLLDAVQVYRQWFDHAPHEDYDSDADGDKLPHLSSNKPEELFRNAEPATKLMTDEL